MSDLKREIKRLQNDIDLNEFIIQNEYQKIKKKIPTKVLKWGIVGGFVGGFLFARKKSLLQIVRAAAVAYFSFKRVSNNANLLLSIIKMKRRR